MFSDKFVRSVVKNLLEKKELTSLPVEPNNVVDKLQQLSKPYSRLIPQDKMELSVALSDIIKRVEDEDVPVVFKTLTKLTRDDDDMKKSNVDPKLEALIRAEVRKIIKENLGDEGLGDERDYKRRKFDTAVDVGGDTFADIAKELGFSVAGAKQAVDKAMKKAQWIAQQMTDFEPGAREEFEIMVLRAMKDYIDLLYSSGEVEPEEYELMLNNPDIVRELDGFREFLSTYIREERNE
jgi:hypothetical protein